MDASTVRYLGFLLAEQARVFGMVAENEACKLNGNPLKYTEDDFNRQAFLIEQLARDV